eukprot:6242551-Pyramimonas_sp.AAC.1
MPTRTPAPDPGDPDKTLPDNDPWVMACNDLFQYPMQLIKDYPGVWASWHSLEKMELLHPKIVKT